MKSLGLLAGAALVLAACSGSEPEPLRISDVSVQADLAAVGSREAVGYWKNLSGDLETAIASEFAGRIDETGPSIRVDVDELSLNSPFMSRATAQTAVLSGRVDLVSPQETTISSYNVTAHAQDVQDFLPSGTTLVSVPPTSAEYYQAIVRAFARGVMITLEGDNAAS
jgi:ABC-type glycerol-3-phosphate transport system substrate-binding protein